MNKKLYLVVKYFDYMEPGDYGVHEEYKLIFATTIKKEAEKIKDFETDYGFYQNVKIIEAELNKHFDTDNAPVLGSSLYIE